MDAVIRAVEKKGVKAHLMNDSEEVEATGAIGYLLWWPRHYASLRIEGGKIWLVDSLKGGLPTHPTDEGKKASVIREVSGGKDGHIVKFLKEGNRVRYEEGDPQGGKVNGASGLGGRQDESQQGPEESHHGDLSSVLGRRNSAPLPVDKNDGRNGANFYNTPSRFPATAQKQRCEK